MHYSTINTSSLSTTEVKKYFTSPRWGGRTESDQSSLEVWHTRCNKNHDKLLHGATIGEINTKSLGNGTESQGGWGKASSFLIAQELATSPPTPQSY